ncbi:MAG: hypothetical protein J6Y75_00990 [Spirochaetaceae bacterium]|nr:hypothetical protein [Spirochaetaceae bacterium]
MKRIFIVTILLLLFLSCTKKNIEPTIAKVKVSEIQKNIETNHINDFTDTVNISVNNKENQESFYNVNSVSTSIQENLNDNYSTIDLLSIIIVDNEIYTLGEEVPKDLKSNFILQNNFFETFSKDAKLDAFVENNTTIGWNNRNRIVFISTENPNAKTLLNIGVGSTKDEVFEKYGEPNMKEANCYKYENYDYEFIGLFFYFNDDTVYKIVSFASI